MQPTPLLRIFHLTDLHLAASSVYDGVYDSGFLEACLELDPDLLSHVGIFDQANVHIVSTLAEEIDYIEDEEPPALSTRYVISGDIATFPYGPRRINRFHQYLRGNFADPSGHDIGLAIPQPSLIPVTGNHDVITRDGITNYAISRFEDEYAVSRDRVDFLVTKDITCVFFSVRTATSLLPFGSILDSQVTWLQSNIQALQEGNPLLDGQTLDKAQYRDALKFLILHHSPLEQDQYPGIDMGTISYNMKQLCGRDGLLSACRSKIDVVLFGHTHIALVTCIDGTVFVDSGSCMAANVWHRDRITNRFHTITVSPNRNLQITQYFRDPGLNGFMRGPEKYFAQGPGGYHEIQH